MSNASPDPRRPARPEWNNTSTIFSYSESAFRPSAGPPPQLDSSGQDRCSLTWSRSDGTFGEGLPPSLLPPVSPDSAAGDGSNSAGERADGGAEGPASESDEEDGSEAPPK